MKILVINCGSSSIKVPALMPQVKRVGKGFFERIGISGSKLSLRKGEKKIRVRKGHC